MAFNPTNPDFKPELKGYKKYGAFRFWCQQVLPLTFDDSLSYYELLNKLVDYLNKTMDNVNTLGGDVESLGNAYNALEDNVVENYNKIKNYLDTYFDNLDVQNQINDKLDEMAKNGSLSGLLAPFIPALVTDWLQRNVTPVGSTVMLDSSLTIDSAAANAKATGDRIADLQNSLRSKFNGKKISIIGDSIETFDETGYKIEGYRMYYPTLGVNNVEDTWWYQVIVNSGASLEVNASWSGSRVTDTHADPTYPDFYDRVSVIGNPDVIFVTLGTNDSSKSVPLGVYDYVSNYESLTESEFRPAYIKGLKALKSLYPNADIICICEQMELVYKESILNIANTLGCEFIDASDYIGSSGVHPGIKGMLQIASMTLYPTDKTLTQNHIPADAKKVGELRDEISAINVPFTITNIRITPTGAITSGNNFYATPPMPCKEGQKIKYFGRSWFYQGSPALSLLSFYDETGNFVSSISVFSSEDNAGKIGHLETTVPSGCAFVRGCSNTNLGGFIYLYIIQDEQVEKASFAISDNVLTNVIKGTFSGASGVINQSNNYIISDIIPDLRYVINENGEKINFCLYKDEQYIGVIKGNGVAEKISGDWYNCVSSLDMRGFLALAGANGCRIQLEHTVESPAEALDYAKTCGVRIICGQPGVKTKINIPFSLSNTRINENGSFVDHNAFYSTEMFPCNPTDIIHCFVRSFFYSGNVASSCIAFYDVNRNFISSVTTPSEETSNTNSEFNYMVPYNAYYAACCSNGNVDNTIYCELFHSSEKSLETALASKYYTNYWHEDGVTERRVDLQLAGVLPSTQDFCYYNGNYYSVEEGLIAKLGHDFSVISSVEIEEILHGNSIQVGFNDDGFAYVSDGINKNVYKINLNTMQYIETITIDINTYETILIDDVNNIAYVFGRDTWPSSSLDFYTFSVYDLTNDTIIRQRKIPYKLSAIQGLDIANDNIYVAFGLGNVNFINKYFIFDTMGCIKKEIFMPERKASEPEGMCYNRDTKDLLVSYYDKNVYKIS